MLTVYDIRCFDERLNISVIYAS